MWAKALQLGIVRNGICLELRGPEAISPCSCQAAVLTQCQLPGQHSLQAHWPASIQSAQPDSTVAGKAQAPTGAIRSVQKLLLSSIFQKAHLRSLGAKKRIFNRRIVAVAGIFCFNEVSPDTGFALQPRDPENGRKAEQMGCDMVVALGGATVTGKALFGANNQAPALGCQSLRRIAGREFALGETVQTQFLHLPQARQTCTVLGCQPANGWGFVQGINEHQLGAGCADWDSKFPLDQPGLTGTDLVRLILERCKNARQGFEVLTGLVAKHGQGRFAQASSKSTGDHIFLLVDPQEAILVEAAGNSWASLECHEVRAVSDAALIRQDWQRIASGLADQVIAQGWWNDDGSKLDFSASLSARGWADQDALRRWGRATFLLEQQNGKIDDAFLRHLLADHYEGTPSEVDPLRVKGPAPLCQHAAKNRDLATSFSFLAELCSAPDHVPLTWCAFGPPCASVYLPVLLDGELPELLTRGPAYPDLKSLWWQTHNLLNAMSSDAETWVNLRQSLAAFQTRIDQETEDFLNENRSLRSQDHAAFARQAALFMQNHAEQLEVEYHRIYAGRTETRKQKVESGI